jgi:tetratricopeptide (TPR) repeat protein
MIGVDGMERSRIEVQKELDLRNAEAYRTRFADPQESLRMSDEVAAQSQQSGYRRGLGYALRTRGAAKCLLSDFDGARADLDAAEATFGALSDERGATHTLLWQGYLEARCGSHASAVEKYQVALLRFRTDGDVEGEISALHMLSGAYLRLSEFNRGRQCAEEAKRLAEEHGDLMHSAVALMNLAGHAGEELEYDRSIHLFDEARRLFQETGDLSNEAVATGNIGVTLRRMGQYAKATVNLRSSLSILQRQGLRGYEIVLLDELSAAYQGMGDLEAAQAIATSAVQLANSLGERMRGVFARVRLAEIRLLQDELGDAEGLLRDALKGAKDAGLVAAESEAYRVLAALHEKRGDPAQALSHYKAHHESQLRTLAAEAEAHGTDRRRIEEMAQLRRDAELQSTRAELQVLKAQMQPHFLLNSLNSIATLLPRDPEEAYRMVLALADLLHLALRQSSTPEVRLREELEFVRRYVEVEQSRRGCVVHVSVLVGAEVMDAWVPHLLLQPFVENAIRHGMRPDAASIHIEIEATVDHDGSLSIRVEDDGAGLPQGWSFNGTGVGLRNTRARLRLLYGTKQDMRLEASVTGGTVVRLRLPMSG